MSKTNGEKRTALALLSDMSDFDFSLKVQHIANEYGVPVDSIIDIVAKHVSSRIDAILDIIVETINARPAK